jgi:hypothetical protein
MKYDKLDNCNMKYDKLDNCNMKYVRETKRILKFRFAEHRGYVNNNDDTAMGEHFNMQVTAYPT